MLKPRRRVVGSELRTDVGETNSRRPGSHGPASTTRYRTAQLRSSKYRSLTFPRLPSVAAMVNRFKSLIPRSMTSPPSRHRYVTETDAPWHSESSHHEPGDLLDFGPIGGWEGIHQSSGL